MDLLTGGGDLGAERRDLVGEFGPAPAAEPHLDLVHAHRPVGPQRLGELLWSAGEGPAAHVPAGRADVQRLADGAHGERALDTCLFAQLPYPCDLRGQPVPRIPLRQPAVALERGPSYGGGRGAADPQRDAVLRRAGPLAESLEVVQLAVVFGELVGSEGGPQGVEALVEHRAALPEVHPQGLELLLDVSGTDPEEQPASAEVVERGVLLGGEQGVPQPDDRDMAEQPDAFGGGGQEGERGDGVVPDGAHRGGQPARDADVVAARQVGEAGPVGGAGDVQQVLGTGLRLPGLGVEGALRLDGKLHPVPQAHRTPPPGHSPSSVSPSSSMAFPRTIRSTTSGARCPICASPTSRDLGQVLSECG